MKKISITDENFNDKEQRILEAAISIFSQKGYSGTSTSEIAKTAKVAEGTIFRYFKTKKDILRGIMIRLINQLSEKVLILPVEEIFSNKQQKELNEILKDIIVDRIKLANNIYPMARVVFTEAMFHEDIRKVIFEKIIKRALELYKNFHLEMQMKHKIRADLDYDVAFRTIISNLFIFIAQRKLFAEEFQINSNDQDKDIDKLIDVIMNGINPKF